MAACEHCSGTHYLSDSPDLGPCICCTPENMQKRDRTIKALSEPPPEQPVIAVLDEIEAAIGAVRNRVAAAEAWREEVFTQRKEAAAALAAYFVSLGLPAVPVTVDHRELAALYEAIGALTDVEP